jgi:uncharacterized protein (TIGR02271 family)
MDRNEATERDARLNESLVGIFRSDNEAIRAITALRQRDFAAHRVGASYLDDEERRPSSARDAGKWFGELRDIFHEDADAPKTWRPENLERLLVDLGIESPDAAKIARQTGPEAALIAVDAADRWREAKVLMEEYGGRTEFIHSPLNRTSAEEVASRVRVHERADSALADKAPIDRPMQAVDAGVRRVEEHDRFAPVGEARHVVAPMATPVGSMPPAQVPETNSSPDIPAAEPGHIQLFGEELRVHKEKLGSGDVRVRKESVTEMQTVQVPVTREHLVVEHTDGSPGSRPDEIRVPLSEERVRVDKDMRLREEYKVGKHEVTDNQPVTESLRRERLVIDHDDETKRE